MSVIDEFAERLVRRVRDQAIQDCDSTFSRGQDRQAEKWRAVLPDGGRGGAIVETLVPDIVDMALSCLLLAIDEGSLRLGYISDAGAVTDLTEEGLAELCGWYAGSGDGAWIDRFSSERRNDYLIDLTLDD